MNGGGEKQKAFSMQGNGATYATGADSIPTAPVTLVPTGVEPGQGADEGVVKMEVAETEEEKRKREKREKKERRKSEKLAAAGAGEGEAAKADGDASPKKEKKEKKEKVSERFVSLVLYLDAPTRDGFFGKLRILTLLCCPFPPTRNRSAPETTTPNLRKRKSRRRKSRHKTRPPFRSPFSLSGPSSSLYHLLYLAGLAPSPCPALPELRPATLQLAQSHTLLARQFSWACISTLFPLPLPSQSGPSPCCRVRPRAGALAASAGLFCAPDALACSPISKAPPITATTLIACHSRRALSTSRVSLEQRNAMHRNGKLQRCLDPSGSSKKRTSDKLVQRWTSLRLRRALALRSSSRSGTSLLVRAQGGVGLLGTFDLSLLVTFDRRLSGTLQRLPVFAFFALEVHVHRVCSRGARKVTKTLVAFGPL